MQIHNAAITGSFTYNGVDISDITGSETSVAALNSFSSSILNYTSSNNANIAALYASTASLYAASASLYNFSSSILSYTSSTDNKIAQLYRETSSLNLATASLNAATASLYNTTASLFSYTSSNNASIADIRVATASLYAVTASINSYTASNNASIADIRVATASLYNATASIYNATASLYNATASLYAATASLNQYTRSLNLNSSSFATTGSNTFVGTQYVSNVSNAISFTSTGSLYSDGGMRITKDMYVSGTAFFNNVTVFGTQSVNYITSSQLNIATNIITVNTATPTVRFGGLAVYDSGSLGTGLTGSLLWDSQNNVWIYSNPSGSETYDSAMMLAGPRNSSGLGNEVGITTNALAKGNGSHHITSSAIFEVSGSVGIGTTSPGVLLQVEPIQTVNLITSLFTRGNSDPNFRAGFANGSGNSAASEHAKVGMWYGTSGNPVTHIGFLRGNSADSLGMTFNVNNTEYVRLNSSGNVGIGTSNPTALLTLDSGEPRFRMNIAGTNHIIINHDGTTGVLRTESATPLDLGTNGSTKMTILSGGNIGIGTTTPNYKLHVYNPNSASYFDGGTTDTSFYISHGSYYPSSAVAGIRTNTGSPVINAKNGGEIYFNRDVNAANVHFQYSTGSNTALFISGSGNVYINSTSGAYPTSGYNLGIKGISSQAFISIARSSQTLDSQGLVLGIDTTEGSLYVRDNLPFSIYTNNAFAVRVAANGNVGIGTTSPGAPLQVVNSSYGNSAIFNTSGAYPIVMHSTSSNGNYYGTSIIMSADSGSTQSGMRIWTRYNAASGVGVAMTFEASTNSQSYGANPTTLTYSEKMRITQDGNVGIGTTNPLALLHVFQSGGNTQLRIGNNSTYDQFIYFNGGNDWSMGMDYSNSNAFVISNYSSIGTNDRVVITTSGNVGIGTTSPQSQTHIYTAGIAGNNYFEGALQVGGSSSSLGAKLSYYSQNSGRATLVNLNNAGGSASTIDLGFGAIDTSGRPTNPVVTVTQGGSVGIGTTSPAAVLDIVGSYSDNAVRVQNTNASSYSATGYVNSSGTLKIAIGVGNASTASPYAGNGYIYTPASTDFVLAMGASERMRITSGGNVGIGTTSPSAKLDVRGSGNTQALSVYQGASGSSAGVYFENTGSISISSARMWLDNLDNFVIARGGGNDRIGLAISASGAIGINTLPTSIARLTISGSTNVANIQGSGSNIFTVDGTSGRLFSVDDDLTNSLFSVNTIAGLPVIEAFADNTVRLGKYNAASGSVMIVTGSVVAIGTSNVSTEANLYLGAQGTSEGGQLVLQKGTSYASASHLDNYQNRFRVMSGTDTTSAAERLSVNMATGDTSISSLSGVGNRAVYSDAGGTLTNSSSDITLKTNIEVITYGLSSVMDLRPVSYNWLPENLGPQKEIGFIAQEVQGIIPEVVGVNNNGTLSLDFPKLTAVLAKAIQELKAEIEVLKNR